MNGYYDRKGQPITALEWMRALEDVDTRSVAGTDCPGGQYVSTVWIGLDHNYGEGPPLIFETMVFPACDECERWSTEREAIEGHAAMVAKLGGPLQ